MGVLGGFVMQSELRKALCLVTVVSELCLLTRGGRSAWGAARDGSFFLSRLSWGEGKAVGIAGFYTI